ncbi:HlyD family efflux transporter periplasmic adaptor subunit [Aequorivita todarodis]|uniref:HlyD family secretion protein n=1 Tax=Aequorivita todarodis TaxID=2036821 RepID=UPI002350DDC2|nr:HlyD family efflux transporter periplasmic adaptor subunit [Aequorivita todarodis]MDC8001348.1 HlyD family efflux transporter periplasmic adaptor subunit [Aequorivita todarodis]
MKNIKTMVLAGLVGSLFSCSNGEKADGYGNFEATEITISSEANGKLEFLNLEEGQVLEKGEVVALVDTLQLYLSKQQLLASKETVASKSGGVWSQVSVLNEQLQTAKTEQERIQNMFAENAATQRQLDQANSQVDVLKKQIKNVETQNAPIVNEVKSIDAKVAQIEEQIAKSKITNPIKGTVLTKYAEPGEIVSFGKPLYKIADLEEMTLRVYVSETQLPNIKIGQEVKVKIDSGEEMKDYQGTISWISASAEFTPKIIQTKEERVNLVYAVKVTVKNDGSLKIGMPAEMWISE